MVVDFFGLSACQVDKREGSGEVIELEIAHDLGTFASPKCVISKFMGDLVFCEPDAHTLNVNYLTKPETCAIKRRFDRLSGQA